MVVGSIPVALRFVGVCMRQAPGIPVHRPLFRALG